MTEEKMPNQWMDSLKLVKRKFQASNLLIFIFIYLLIIIGMIFVFSATMYAGKGTGGRAVPFSYVSKQLTGVFVGSAMMAVMMLLPNKWYRSLTLIQVVLAVVDVILLYTALFGEVIYGASNWFNHFGINFQPAELYKATVAILVAWHMSFPVVQWSLKKLINNPMRLLGNRRGLISLGLIIFGILAMAKMPDYGMIMLILIAIFVAISINKWSLKQNIILYTSGAVAYYLFLWLANFKAADWINSEYHFFVRLGIFTNPFIDPLNKGFQLIQSIVAVSRGGWLGKGIGQGITKQLSLPEGQNDFIFAIMTEELGFVKIIAFLVFMLGVYLYLFKQALDCKDVFRKNVIIGLTIMFIVQSVVNIGGVLSVIPLTGVTLPFISSGGTSMMISMATIGIIQAMIIQERLAVNQVNGSDNDGKEFN
ncbi:FtsW/RodA/SpoVE family cell cycle protein [Tuanshanicoccus lijuaniae]|uniref:FtsW/RodA/SpoVE family cell cycle protein n=1 Tax=Aerococcaceae bacterium zg-1292 TaxID=2774330 RepID=UPI00193596C3|nr:FtsW/RodA/SpoVE family cell cycle protein [Aerococcaceae bacterium zg-1292]QQA37734.1 FtsW/RodA/SpoVE family cell cycle protein [Aerococcaceae bacterium zg-1292]